MVHGGGHHHHSGGGGGSAVSPTRTPPHHSNFNNQWNSNPWGFWGPQYNTNPTNVVVVNNTDRDRGERRRRSSRTRPRSEHSGECTQCCRRCCLGCCTCWLVSSAATQEEPKCGPMTHWVFLSLCFFVLLVVTSGVNETWTFNAGETRRVLTRRILTRRVEIQSQVANGIVTYYIQGKCPPLTGPVVPLDESLKFRLAPDDYQYDYYYLIEGSTLTVTFQQHKGATRVSLLKGESQLRQIESDEDYPSFASQALLTRYAAQGTLASTTFTYTASESDVYIIVYDNASSFPGKANTTIHVDLATYNLSNQTPYEQCQPLSCSVDTSFSKNCILLQAPSSGKIVTVHISAKRQWIVIVVLSLLPCIIAFLLPPRRPCQRRQYADGGNADSSSPSTIPLVPETQQQQADYEAIPIVADADVIPVAVPVDGAEQSK